MQDIQALIEYFSTSRPLIVIGSGPSCELGLPTWQGLAEHVLNQLRLVPGLPIEPAEEAFAKQDYAAFFGKAVKVAGSATVYQLCEERLKDNGGVGDQYELIARLPARGFITTNFDSILKRHFDLQGAATLEFLNTPEDLAGIEFEVTRSILKIHGDFSRPDYLILTDRQYREILHDGRFLALREFIKAYLQTSRIVFIGYSLKDPDFSFLLEATAQTLRRKVPLFGIVANAPQDLIDEWFDRYNLHVISYRSTNHDHSDLKSILETLASYFSALSVQGEAVPFVAAQSLYMWHKMATGEGTEATVDALKAILLGIASFNGSPLSQSSLLTEITKITQRTTSDALVQAVSRALQLLLNEKMLEVTAAGLYSATSRGKALETKYSSQFNNLKQLFETQIRLDLTNKLPRENAVGINTIVARIHSCVLKIFSDRGGELVDASFAGRFEAPSSMNLVRIINSFTSDLDEGKRYFLFSYLMTLMTRPRDEQKAYLDYLAKAFFAAQVIGVDPEGQTFRREVLKARTLIVDANVLIPLLAVGSANQQYMKECIDTLRDAGVKLITIPKFCEEVSSHFQWAVDHVRRHGAQSMEVFSAALGTTEFRRNECIDGFIRQSADHDYTIDEYLDVCFGGDPNFYNVRNACMNLGIEPISLNDLAEAHQELWSVQAETERYISELQIDAETPKSEPRIKAEADAYTICYGWIHRAPQGVDHQIWKCSILSRGTSLNRVARFGPNPLQRPVIVRPDVLQEFIRDFIVSKQTTSISDVMLATYVRSVDYFIDKEKYSQFFRPLIKEAERIYSDNLDRFQALLDEPISLADLDQYDDLDKPFVVNSLQKNVVKAVDTEVHRLTSELRSLQIEKRRNEELAKLAMSYLSPTLRKRIERLTSNPPEN